MHTDLENRIDKIYQNILEPQHLNASLYRALFLVVTYTRSDSGPVHVGVKSTPGVLPMSLTRPL